jgi:DnaK suppressor protein
MHQPAPATNESALSSTDIEHCRMRLHAKARELRQTILGRAGAITVEPAADPIDEVRGAADREVAIETLDRDSSLLAQVNLALDLLENGEYGICEDCGGSISPQRLAAVVWATRCLRCQAEFERSTEESPGFPQTASGRPRGLTAA